jgi:hypothetical protein
VLGVESVGPTLGDNDGGMGENHRDHEHNGEANQQPLASSMKRLPCSHKDQTKHDSRDESADMCLPRN